MNRFSAPIRWLLLTVACLMAPAFAMACIWIHGTTLDGKYQSMNGMGFQPRHIEEMIERKPDEQSRLFELHTYRPEDPVAALNDEAVQVLIKGDAALAVKKLEEVERVHPGSYYTAANLGTALELAGRDEDAIKWILEGIRRNPESHMLTEWLHVRILEAKVQMKTDPHWLNDHTITGVDIAKLGDENYTIDSAQGIKDRHEIRESLQQQLLARMLFVKPKDPIVAQLLAELAHLESHLGSLENSVKYLNIAGLYGPYSPATAAFRTHIEAVIKDSVNLFDINRYPTVRKVWQPLALVVLFVLLGWAVYRRYRNKHSKKFSDPLPLA